MKAKYELTEAEIKEAIAGWIKTKTGAEVNAKDVYLTAQESRDCLDRPTYGHTITAEVG